MWNFSRAHCPIYPLVWFLVNYCVAEPLAGDSVRAAMDREFSFVVSIGYKVAESNLIERQFCSGAVVTTKHVVTAASCLKTKVPSDLQILGGSNNINLCESYDIASWITYNSWAKKNMRLEELEVLNIAIITLSREVDQSKIDLVLISPKPTKLFYGTIGTLVGWGDMKDGSTPEILQASTVNIMTKEKCLAKSFKAATKKLIESEKILCSELDPALRHGDEGGPLVYGRNILIGVNMKRNLDKPNYEYLKANYHNSLDNYRRFFYDATAGSQFLVA